jgi:transposase-like protein
MPKPRPALFKWRHFEPEIIVCAVRWYLRFSLSYRDVEELLMERGLPADHTTIWRWVQRYAPELNKRCRRELKLKREGKLGRRCRCRTCPYLSNVVEQDHRGIKRRVNASQGFRSFDGALRTIQGYEILHMIRKGQVRWLPKGDVLGQIQFIRETFGLKS